MGICTSSNENEIIDAEEDEKKREAARQRRKLSLQPGKVGDIDTGYNRKPSTATDDTKASVIETSNEDARTIVLGEATASRKGYVPYNRGKVNQDRAVISYGLKNSDHMNLFGVMDGHGEYGHLVAEFVMKNLAKYLSQEDELKVDNDNEKIANAIKSAIDNLVGSLNKTRINCHFSGTTCVFGVLIDKVMHVANIGDSRCVMARRNSQGGIDAIPLSEDQKPENPEEKARILEAGGRVQPLPGLEGEDCGPMRVWLAEVNVPGLAMSRSIGDHVCNDVGVTHEPEVKPHTIQDNDLFAVWASDGVWEFLSNEEVINIVWANRKDLKTAANKLIEESANQWKMQEEVIDDITAVIVKFNAFE